MASKLDSGPPIHQLMKRGINLRGAGRPDEAAVAFEAVLRRNPIDTHALSLLGYVRMQQGHLKRAVQLLERSLRLNPRQPLTWNNYAVALVELERFDDALASFDRAITLEPGFRVAHDSRRTVLERKVRDEAARNRFERAIACHPENANLKSIPPLYVFCYHKTGTVLFERIIRSLADRYCLLTAVRVGNVSWLPRNKHIVLFGHSILADDLTFERPFRAVRVVRDPRDVWVSSYLYHRRCQEPWCLNADFDPTPPIRFPKVDHSMVHRSESWKRTFLANLHGRSYQQKLLDLDRQAGLRFELQGYTGCTLEAMRQWWSSAPEVLQIKLEAIVEQFDSSMLTIFRHLELTEAQCQVASELAAAEDIARMDDAAFAMRPHIHSRQVSKWRDFLNDDQVREFERKYGDLIVDLGYQLSSPEPGRI